MTGLSIDQMLNGVIGSRLEPLLPAPGHEWHLWEHKTLNIHRGVLLWRPQCRLSSLDDVSSSIRSIVSERFQIRRLRGFAFGAVVELDKIPNCAPELVASIDARANRRGTWQWLILLSKKTASAVAVHTWFEGYLTPIYDSFLGQLELYGFATAIHERPKDMWMQTLEEIANRGRLTWWVNRAIQALTKRSAK